MHIEQLRDYCITKKGVTEHFPFDNVTLVFKVMNKMFLLTGLDAWEQGETKMNVKCDPEWSEELLPSPFAYKDFIVKVSLLISAYPKERKTSRGPKSENHVF